MKRLLSFAAAATVLFAACQKTEVVYDNPDPQEIALFAVNKVATKAPVSGATFSTGDNMQVAAYLVDGAEAAGNFFKQTEFRNTSAGIWSGHPARYWPITTSTINFLAVTDTGGGVDNTTVEFHATNYASSATVTLADNNVSDQNDLMFAAGSATHTEGTPYTAAQMVFKHALAWVNFTVTTPTTGAEIRVNKITLNNARYNGTLTLTNNQYNSTTENTTTSVDATWAGDPTATMVVPSAPVIVDGVVTPPAAANAVILTASPQAFGNGLLVIPNASMGTPAPKAADSFTINYTLTQADGTFLTYDYTHNFADDTVWEMAHKYTYNVSITLSEIQITPSVTPWDVSGTSSSVPLNGNNDL